MPKPTGEALEPAGVELYTVCSWKNLPRFIKYMQIPGFVNPGFTCIGRDASLLAILYEFLT